MKMNTRPPPPPLPKATAPAKKPEALPTTKHQQPKQKALPAPNVRHSTKRAVTEQEATERLRREATTYPAPREVDPTEDYWIRESNLWKRVHTVPRTTLYVPQQRMDGPDITKVLPERTTFVHPTSGIRPFRIDDDWTTKQSATLNIEWTGSTNFEETTVYKDEYIEDDEEYQRAARQATGIKAPAQPTAQERAEHELTHLPYRSWCPTCVQNKGSSDNHPRQQSKLPVIQFDFCFFTSHGETSTTPILTGIDVEKGLSMAILVGSKTQDFNYHAQAISTFLMECGRVQGVLNNTILQSDQEEHLMALLKAAAARTGGNISVRQAPSYTSQARGSVERFHRTLMGQIRTLKSQLFNSYGIHLTVQHPLMPWLVRHTAYLLNRYAIHANGNISYFRRWYREHKTPICEFGETVKYMLPTSKLLPKLEQRFFPGIWLGKDTASSENIIGIANKVVKARTIRRQPLPEKYKQATHGRGQQIHHHQVQHHSAIHTTSDLSA